MPLVNVAVLAQGSKPGLQTKSHLPRAPLIKNFSEVVRQQSVWLSLKVAAPCVSLFSHLASLRGARIVPLDGSLPAGSG